MTRGPTTIVQRGTPRRGVAVAAFVSPHGFGHAARACAVMQELHRLDPDVTFEIFTLVPEWFFTDSLRCPFSYHRLLTDVGLVQESPFVEDPAGTLRELARFLPFADPRLDGLAKTLAALDCRLALCDISPLGIAVAESAGIPSVLVENFTWDWIYEPYAADHRGFAEPITALAAIFARATVHVQAEPLCRPREGAALVPPISRAPRTPRGAVRDRLGVASGVPLVLVTMGGVPWRPASLERLERDRELVFVVPGAADRLERRGSLIALPHRSGFFHPDLVRAADAVVGKLGYSTVAEVYAAGVPFAYVPRPTFRESDALARFAAAHLLARALPPEELTNSDWVGAIPELLGRGRRQGERTGGAVAAAALLRAALPDA